MNNPIPLFPQKPKTESRWYNSDFAVLLGIAIIAFAILSGIGLAAYLVRQSQSIPVSQ
jgi:hypothetical protein